MDGFHFFYVFHDTNHTIGHGGKVRDDDGDEEDGYDETLSKKKFEKKAQFY